MKNTIKFIILLVFICLITRCVIKDGNPSSNVDNQVPIQVDPAIEIISSIHYLAGTGQYDEMLFPDYLAEVENYFGHLRNYPAVLFSKEINNFHNINGSAPMTLAVYLGPPPSLEPHVDLSTSPEDLDPRWTSTLINDFLEKARAFAIESNFMDFYNSHKEFHELAINNLKKMNNLNGN